MDCHAVKILGLYFCIDQGIQLIDCERECVELLLSGVQVGADVLAEEDLPCFLVGIDHTYSQQESEVLA